MEIINQLKEIITEYFDTLVELAKTSESIITEAFAATKVTVIEIVNTLNTIDFQFFI